MPTLIMLVHLPAGEALSAVLLLSDLNLASTLYTDDDGTTAQARDVLLELLAVKLSSRLVVDGGTDLLAAGGDVILGSAGSIVLTE